MRPVTNRRQVYLPGELIPFRPAILDQETCLQVAAAGMLAIGEIVPSGRFAAGEPNLFTRPHHDVAARPEGRLVLLEHARLDPTHQL